MSHLVLHEGSVFAERYRVVRCIAQGGMGAVYEVVHIETNKHRALKVMLPNMLQAKGMQERFQQEARVTSGIESEFIVEVMDAGIDASTQTPFLVMELLRGEDLNRRLKRMGRFEPREVVTLLRQAAMALDKTHKASIVHRDLKPENLFLTERDDGSPRIKILDFGVAKLVADSTTSANATQSLGTPLYMSPEQFQHGGAISPAADIYALGLIAYTLLVGVSYWQDEIDSGTNIYVFVGVALHGMRESPVARAARRGVTLPAGFDAWCARAAAMKPADRFQGALEAVNALADVFGFGLGTTGSLEKSLNAGTAASSAPTPLSSSAPPAHLSAAAARSGPQVIPNAPVLPLSASSSYDFTTPFQASGDIFGNDPKPAPPLQQSSPLPGFRVSTDIGMAATASQPAVKSSKRGWVAAGAVLSAVVIMAGIGGWAFMSLFNTQSTAGSTLELAQPKDAIGATSAPAPSVVPQPTVTAGAEAKPETPAPTASESAAPAASASVPPANPPAPTPTASTAPASSGIPAGNPPPSFTTTNKTAPSAPPAPPATAPSTPKPPLTSQPSAPKPKSQPPGGRF